MVLNPQIKVNVQENLTLTAPGGQAVIAIAGTAQWGSIADLQSFSSFSQLLDYYKEDKSTLTQGIVKAADLAYLNGANSVKVIRIADSSKAKSVKALAGNSGVESGVLTFSGIYYGTYGDNILVTVTTKGSGRILEITDGVLTERYDNASNANGYATNAAIGTAINGVSSLVTVAVKAGSETTNLVDAASNQALASGNDGATSIASSDYTTAFDTFLANELWDVLIAPGTDALNALDAFHTTMNGKLNTRATTDKKFGIFISGVTQNETVGSMQSRTTAGERLVLCAPGIKYTPRYSGAVEGDYNGTFMACCLAGLIAAGDIETAPTRKVLSVSPIVTVSSGKEYYNNSEIEQVLQQRIVPVSKIEGAIKVARGVTRIADTTSIYFEINIVRIVDYVKAGVQTLLDPFLGQSNLTRIRNVMGKSVDQFLQTAKDDSIIADYRTTEVSVGSSPDTVNVSMTIQPTFSINFITVNVSVVRL